MKLTIIGCTGSMSGPDSAASSYLVQADGADPDGEVRTWSVVLDLGPGAMGQMLRYLDPIDLDAILISHCHADHIVDLVGMHVFRRWNPTGALGPVLTLGPGELRGRLNGVDGTSPEETYASEFSFRTAVVGQAVQVGPLKIMPYEALHPVEADGVDLLLSEAAFLEGRDTYRGMHLTGRRAGELAAGTSGEGGRRPAGSLVLTHIQPWTDPADTLKEAAEVYSGPLEAATAGASWEI